MEKIKIVQFIFGLNDGGAETLVKDYALLLDRKKFEIIIYCLQPIYNSSNYKIISQHGITVRYVFDRLDFMQKLYNKTLNTFYGALKIRNFIKQDQPQIIHAHLSTLKYLSFIRKDLKDIKLFYTCHNMPNLIFDKDPKNYKAAKKLVKCNNLKLIALHEDMKNDLNQRFCVNNTEVVKNGIDFSRYKSIVGSKSTLRNIIGLNCEDFVVGHVGRFSYQKNHIFLLSIFKELITVKENAKLLLVGSGNLKSDIQNKAKELGLSNRIVFLEHRTDIPEILSTMDVFVFPSFYEGLPLSVIEAQIMNLRCIISDSINRECVISRKTITLNINSGADAWVNAILDDNLINNDFYDSNEFDMNTAILKLKKMYLNSLIDLNE